MNEPAKIRIEAEIDAETYQVMRDLLQRQGRDERAFIAEAVRRAAAHETEWQAFVQEGIDAADWGQVISQEEMERWLEERIAARQAG